MCLFIPLPKRWKHHINVHRITRLLAIAELSEKIFRFIFYKFYFVLYFTLLCFVLFNQIPRMIGSWNEDRGMWYAPKRSLRKGFPMSGWNWSFSWNGNARSRDVERGTVPHSQWLAQSGSVEKHKATQQVAPSTTFRVAAWEALMGLHMEAGQETSYLISPNDSVDLSRW